MHCVSLRFAKHCKVTFVINASPTFYMYFRDQNILARRSTSLRHFSLSVQALINSNYLLIVLVLCAWSLSSIVSIREIITNFQFNYLSPKVIEIWLTEKSYKYFIFHTHQINYSQHHGQFYVCIGDYKYGTICLANLPLVFLVWLIYQKKTS